MLAAGDPRWAEEWPAPAKLNLLLHIVGRRADGYHLLETVFQLLEHGDTIRFTPRADGQVLRRGGLADVPAAQDLVIKAARLLFAKANCQHGVEISLTKRLPAGGGLGGGSSDAATVLVVLNQLFQLGFDEDSLAEIGLRLGADVPLFVRGYSAWATGVGEHLSPIDLPEQWFVVATPPISIGTADIFTRDELQRATPSINPSSLSFEAGALPGRNDCQLVAVAQFPQLTELLTLMSRYAPTRMTGTGSSVFSVFDSRVAAEAAAAELPNTVNKFVCRGVNSSVLQNKLQKLFSSS